MYTPVETAKPDKLPITVVTVCLNSAKEIEDTIRSVLEQDYAGFEYLIKDGGSDDSTVRIAEGYAESFGRKNISYRIISEQDGGLYDAMNSAAGYAQGEWILYLNAGDMLLAGNVLSRLASCVSDEIDVLYGDAVLFENGRYKLLKAGSAAQFKYRNPICHQASLTRADIIRKYAFDTRYPIAADFDLFLKILSTGVNKLKQTDDALCVFRLGGISNSNILQREKEFDSSRKRNRLKRVRFPEIQILEIVLTDLVRKAAIRILGSGFYSQSRGWYKSAAEAVRQGEDNA
ncbi:MAG: glycosyltransferase [Lachnospiraceae bacterium]|nr:glycosyltransferase [Lachnospiraceae bacterium]